MHKTKALPIVIVSICLMAIPSIAAADWFLSAETKALIAKAEAGDAEAQVRVASAYDTGKGAPRSASDALKYYLMAAQQGHAESQNSVGSILQAEKRYPEALPWFERAAAQRHAQATNNLAYFYDMGFGVAQDRRKGFELYTRAADLGWAEAMWNIANMYGLGQIGDKDMLMACVWTYRAGRFAKPAERRLAALTERTMSGMLQVLSSEQFASCEQQGKAWSPQVGGES